MLLDDDEHTYQYVIDLLGHVFGYGREKSFAIACVVDSQGRAIVETAGEDSVLAHQRQIHAFGADPRMPACQGSMSAIIEKAPVMPGGPHPQPSHRGRYRAVSDSAAVACRGGDAPPRSRKPRAHAAVSHLRRGRQVPRAPAAAVTPRRDTYPARVVPRPSARERDRVGRPWGAPPRVMGTQPCHSLQTAPAGNGERARRWPEREQGRASGRPDA